MRGNVIKEYTIENITLWILSLEEASETDLEEMYALCSRQRREKSDRIKPGMKRNQSIGAGYLLYLLKERFSITKEPVILPGGKPVFQEDEAVHFSISHSRGTVLLAFGDRPLGADIEYVKKPGLKIAERFFTKQEHGGLLELDEEGQKDAFCRIWAGKEAVVKAAGSGLSTSLNRFSVLEETAEFSGERYELYRQKFMAKGQSAWICVAQLITDSPKTIRCNPGQKEKRQCPEAFASGGLLLSGR